MPSEGLVQDRAYIVRFKDVSTLWLVQEVNPNCKLSVSGHRSLGGSPLLGSWLLMTCPPSDLHSCDAIGKPVYWDLEAFGAKFYFISERKAPFLVELRTGRFNMNRKGLWSSISWYKSLRLNFASFLLITPLGFAIFFWNLCGFILIE